MTNYREWIVEEKTFFEYDDVKVTNARFITGGQTFAMNNVTSVKTRTKKPSRWGGIFILLIGLSMMAANALFGLAIVAAAAYYLYKQKTIYDVMLTTSGGETSALKTNQLEYITKVVNALNDAIVHRG